MTPRAAPPQSIDDANARLDAFLAEYTPDVAALARAVLAALRRHAKGAVEMVYDNYNALVVGFAPNDRPSSAVLSIGVYPRYVNLYFLNGTRLDDPGGVLQGKGNRVRHVQIRAAKEIGEPALKRLIAAAVARAEPPFDRSANRRIVIRGAVTKRRPRRPLGT